MIAIVLDVDVDLPTWARSFPPSAAPLRSLLRAVHTLHCKGASRFRSYVAEPSSGALAEGS